MQKLRTAQRLGDQVYEAIVDEICDGRLEPGTHLVQEQLAETLGVSRQPVQQAMARLKADGMVDELGRRGLFVAPLDSALMRHHYAIRAALDGYAARAAAERARADRRFAAELEREGRAVLRAGKRAVAAGSVSEQIRQDVALHQLIYARSGNPLLARTAEPHWRFLRRAMGDVLRRAAPPRAIWRQHRDILASIVSGDAAEAERRAVTHVEEAAERLVDALATTAAGTNRAEPQHA